MRSIGPSTTKGTVLKIASQPDLVRDQSTGKFNTIGGPKNDLETPQPSSKKAFNIQDNPNHTINNLRKNSQMFMTIQENGQAQVKTPFTTTEA